MSDNTKDNIVDVSDAARSVPTMLLLLLTRRFPFSVLTPSNLLSLGNSNEFDCSRLLADFTFPFISYPLRFALPSVAMGIATLRGHRMTFSHSSKDPLRPLT